MGVRMNSEIASLTLRALRRVLRATEIGSRQLASTTGLTPSQLLVLREIDTRGSDMPSAVAQTLQFSQATITAIVDRLVATMTPRTLKRTTSSSTRKQSSTAPSTSRSNGASSTTGVVQLSSMPPRGRTHVESSGAWDGPSSAHSSNATSARTCVGSIVACATRYTGDIVSCIRSRSSGSSGGR